MVVSKESLSVDYSVKEHDRISVISMRKMVAVRGNCTVSYLVNAKLLYEQTINIVEDSYSRNPIGLAQGLYSLV